MENKFTIARDTQEKSGFWQFQCHDVEDVKLVTGDYSVRGLETLFTIERKKTTGEFSGNITDKRFDRELQRMHKMKHSFLIFEFNLEDVLKFPRGSSIPPSVWPKLRVTSGFLLKKIIEIQTRYNINVIFAGNRENAEKTAIAIFKRMVELYPDKTQ